MKKTVFIFSALIIALLTLFQISKFLIIFGKINIEIIITFIAILSFFIGLYINRKASLSNENSPKEINHKKIEELGITAREYETLQLITLGLSNKEISEKLFLSESTVKTHVSKLFFKLNSKRRTQAIKIAKEMNIIA